MHLATNRAIRFLLPFAHAGIFVAIVNYWHPFMFIDDAGFVLRYMRHFGEGCFFCFNPQDGPVFGLSGFIYGLLGGILNYAGLMGPEASLIFLNLIGTYAFAVLIFKILEQFSKNLLLTIPAWVLVMFSSVALIVSFNSGMETAVHLTIVIAALYAFLKKKDRLMWGLLALSVISKLDAVPVAVVVGLIWIISNFREIFQEGIRSKALWTPILFGLIPVIIWIIFATIVFGSPLPQSANSKLNFGQDNTSDPFPFFTAYFNNVSHYISLGIFLFSFLILLGRIALVRTSEALKFIVPGLSFIGVMTLYYFYNPAEKMFWYYAMPETLMYLQIGIFFVGIPKWLDRSWVKFVVPVLLCLIIVLRGKRVNKSVRWFLKHTEIVELERKLIGDYIQSRTTPDDTVYVGHGLVSWNTPGYVVDVTGLNFRLDPKYRYNKPLRIKDYNPKWMVFQGIKSNLKLANQFDYYLDRSFYDVSFYGPTWRIFRRYPASDPDFDYLKVLPGNIEVDFGSMKTEKEITAIKGNKVYVTVQASDMKQGSRTGAFDFGVRRKEKQFSLEIFSIEDGRKVYSTIVEVEAIGADPEDSRYSKWVSVFAGVPGPIPSTTVFEIKRSDGLPIEVIDPGITFSTPKINIP